MTYEKNIKEDNDLRDILAACISASVQEDVIYTIILTRSPSFYNPTGLIEGYKRAMQSDSEQCEHFNFDAYRYSPILASHDEPTGHDTSERNEDDELLDKGIVATRRRLKRKQEVREQESETETEDGMTQVFLPDKQSEKKIETKVNSAIGGDDDGSKLSETEDASDGCGSLTSPCINESIVPDPPSISLDQPSNIAVASTAIVEQPTARNKRPMLIEPPNVLYRVESARAKAILGLTHYGHILSYWYRSGQIYATLDEQFTKRLTYSITANDIQRAEKYLADKSKETPTTVVAAEATPAAKFPRTAKKESLSQAKLSADISKYETSISTARQARDDCAAQLQTANACLRKATIDYESCAEIYRSAEKHLLNAEETHLDIQDKLGSLNSALTEAKRALIAFKRQQGA